MSHVATARLLLHPAPGGLAVVQDLLNTRAIGHHRGDLLASAGEAREWLLDLAVVDPGGTSWLGELGDRDLDDLELNGLRTLRGEVEQLVAGTVAVSATPLTRTALVVGEAGELTLRTAGSGWREFASRIWIEVFLAQRAGTWDRLKLCRNPVCGSAFYDRSKNNSGVWHDAKVCGNAANLRASRARRRATQTS